MLCVGRAMGLQINMHVYFGFAFFLFGQKQDHSHLSHPPFIWKLLTRAREHERMECVPVVWGLEVEKESVVLSCALCCAVLCCVLFAVCYARSVYISSAYGMLGDFPSSVVRTMSKWTDLFMLRAERVKQNCDFHHFTPSQPISITYRPNRTTILSFSVFIIFRDCWNQSAI